MIDKFIEEVSAGAAKNKSANDSFNRLERQKAIKPLIKLLAKALQDEKTFIQNGKLQTIFYLVNFCIESQKQENSQNTDKDFINFKDGLIELVPLLSRSIYSLWQN